MTTVINFDGACELNPANGKRNPGGIATYGWLIKKDDLLLAYGLGEAARGENATNNLAEYTALICALEAAHDLRVEPDEIRGDSQLVVNQVNGEWRVNKPHLADLCQRAQQLIRDYVLVWVPREQNQEADDLSKKAYEISRQSNNGSWYSRKRLVR